MKKLSLLFVALIVFADIHAQFIPKTFGEGLNFTAPDSSFSLKFGVRFQNLYQADWNLPNDNFNPEDYAGNFRIRRARLKFNGHAFSPDFTYKVELALTNNDLSSSGTGSQFSNVGSLVLDAYADWNFYENLSIRFGQFKLPGNVERVISSGDLQLVDRSLLNSRFNIDRDLGFMLHNTTDFGANIYSKQYLVVSQGEGRNITVGDLGGYSYTARLEFLPLGLFYKDKDDYVGSALYYYSEPKFMIGGVYERNNKAARTQGQLGNFIQDATGKYFGKNLNTYFVDAVFKYKMFSFMGEYVNKYTSDNNPVVYDAQNNKIATYMTGEAVNLQAGILLNKKVSAATGKTELVGRYTSVDYQNGNDEVQYTIGLNRFLVDHKLKVQSDLTYRQIENRDDELMFRFQLDVHF